MSDTLYAAPGSTVRLSMTLDDYASSGVYPRARVYNEASGLLIATVDLSHVAFGRWESTYALPAAPGGSYIVHYAVYSDAGHTVLSTRYAGDQDRILSNFQMIWNELRANSGVAGSYGQAIKVMLGITAKANMRIDKTTYDANGFLETARIRIFETAAAATSATVDALDGVDGEIWRVDLAGVADLTHLILPDNVLGVLS